jgi:hypothetical protein
VAVQTLQERLQEAETTGEIVPARQAERDVENLRLLVRFLLGGLLMSSGSFMQTLRDVQHEIEAAPGLPEQRETGEDESLRDLLRHLSVGLLVQGTEEAFQIAKSGFHLSLDLTRRLIVGVDRVTDNRLVRPMRQAMITRLQRLEDEAETLIDLGRAEEEKARLLTGDTMDILVDDVMETVATSPELNDMIRGLVAQQGKGVAAVVGDNARTLTLLADSATERFVRRLFKRRPRQELPSSPLRGVPQDMYSAKELEEENWHEQ